MTHSFAFRTMLGLGACTALAACNFSGSKDAPPNATSGSTGAVGGTSAPAGSAPSNMSQTPLRPNGSVLTNPSNQDMVFLYYSLASQKAPLDDWANRDASAVTSDEFARAKKAAEIIGEYQQKLAAQGAVGKLAIDLNATLGEYDPKLGEFPIEGLGPDNFVNYDYNGVAIEMSFVNGAAASHWKLTPDAAESAFKQNKSLHNVTLEMSLDIVGVDPSANGGTIRTRITGYKILSPYGRAQLGEISL